MNTFGNVAEYKINMQKYVAFLYAKKEQPETEIRKKSIHNSLKQTLVGLAMKKEIEEGTRRGKTFHVLELAELIL
jgi:hypothetical protein